VHGSAVGGRDRGHQREAETEAVVTRAVVEARERQEQTVELVGRDDAAGVDDPDQRSAVLGCGRDRDGAVRDVVALGVVEQVGDEPFEQHPVAGDEGCAKRGDRPDPVRGTALERVLGEIGQIEWVGEDARLISRTPISRSA